jgi:hypothetical protein
MEIGVAMELLGEQAVVEQVPQVLDHLFQVMVEMEFKMQF